MASMGKSAGLMVMLMLAALVVSAQADGRTVVCKNDLERPIKCNGHEIMPGHEDSIELLELDVLILLVLDIHGKWVPGHCNVDKGVTKVLIYLNAAGLVEVKVIAVVGGLIGALLAALLGKVLLVVLVALNL